MSKRGKKITLCAFRPLVPLLGFPFIGSPCFRSFGPPTHWVCFFSPFALLKTLFTLYKLFAGNFHFKRLLLLTQYFYCLYSYLLTMEQIYGFSGTLPNVYVLMYINGKTPALFPGLFAYCPIPFSYLPFEQRKCDCTPRGLSYSVPPFISFIAKHTGAGFPLIGYSGLK